MKFLRSPLAEQLRFIDFSINDIDDEVLFYIAENGDFQNLEVFQVNDCKSVTSIGVISFLKSERLPNLKKLSLVNTEVDDILVDTIKERSNNLKGLEWVDIRGCNNISSIPEELIYFPQKI